MTIVDIICNDFFFGGKFWIVVRIFLEKLGKVCILSVNSKKLMQKKKNKKKNPNHVESYKYVLTFCFLTTNLFALLQILDINFGAVPHFHDCSLLGLVTRWFRNPRKTKKMDN
jgi:hypothetical protein